ncbi:HAD family hydrolase [Jiangella endophytica]|uniref:HAD family hydrolase n=1 Tax=Jiangella endophytica TaxID=1623398 RepID=UPI0018E52B74|nr:HAD hydrolase family protein [Jiangella endophytica]
MTHVVVSDLDGTVAFAGRPPSAIVMHAFDRIVSAAGTRLVIATSRAPRSVAAWFGPLVGRVDLICCNGALVRGRDGTERRTPLGGDLVAAMVADLVAADADFCLDYGDRFVASRPRALPWMGRYRRHVLGPAERPSVHGVLKLSVAHADPWAWRLHTAAPGRSTVYVHTTGDADLVAPGVGKAGALRDLLGDDARAAFVTAFGNDANDLELLRAADRGFVVGAGLPVADRLAHLRRLPADDGQVAAALLASVAVPSGLTRPAR